MKETLTALQTTASTQNHQPAPKTAPAIPGPKIVQTCPRSMQNPDSGEEESLMSAGEAKIEELRDRVYGYAHIRF